jgi:hypothetical protein
MTTQIRAIMDLNTDTAHNTDVHSAGKLYIVSQVYADTGTSTVTSVHLTVRLHTNALNN